MALGFYFVPFSVSKLDYIPNDGASMTSIDTGSYIDRLISLDRRVDYRN